MVLDFIPVEPLIQLIQQHGVIAVVLGMIAEEIIVPIPSPVVPMAAGALLVESTSLAPALFEILFLIAIPASIASVISSYFVYGIAYYGGKPVLQRYGRWLDITWEDVQHLEHHFDHEHEKYYVAIFRAAPVLPLSLISGAAGLFRMDWKTYGIWSFIGMLPRNFVLALIGWTVKDDFVKLASRIDTISTAVIVIVAAAVGFVIVYRKTHDFYRWLLIQSKEF
ncbi:MAG: DedA family protein [Candidatus Nanohaloarchaea archaeon]